MATLPSFRTWVAGEIVTAAYLNSNVRDAGNFFLSWPVCETRQTLAQSLTNSTATTILYDTNDIDTDSGHSTSTNTSRYTGKTAGRFQISGGIGYASNATGQRWVEWQKNGTSINGGGVLAAPVNGQITRLPARTMTVFLNGSTDYVELMGLQTSGGALNTAVSAADQPTLSVRMVGTT